MRVFGLGGADGLDNVVVGKGAGVHLLVEEVLEALARNISPILAKQILRALSVEVCKAL